MPPCDFRHIERQEDVARLDGGEPKTLHDVGPRPEPLDGDVGPVSEKRADRDEPATSVKR